MTMIRPVSSSLLTTSCQYGNFYVVLTSRQIDSSELPVIFTVLEPASVLICACLPTNQGLLKRLSKTKLMSYLSFSLTHSSRTSSNNKRSQSIRDSELKPGQWTELDEASLSSQANKSEGHTFGHRASDGNEGYELATATGSPRKERDIV